MQIPEGLFVSPTMPFRLYKWAEKHKTRKNKKLKQNKREERNWGRRWLEFLHERPYHLPYILLILNMVCWGGEAISYFLTPRALNFDTYIYPTFPFSSSQRKKVERRRKGGLDSCFCGGRGWSRVLSLDLTSIITRWLISLAYLFLQLCWFHWNIHL